MMFTMCKDLMGAGHTFAGKNLEAEISNTEGNAVTNETLALEF